MLGATQQPDHAEHRHRGKRHAHAALQQRAAGEFGTLELGQHRCRGSDHHLPKPSVVDRHARHPHQQFVVACMQDGRCEGPMPRPVPGTRQGLHQVPVLRNQSAVDIHRTGHGHGVQHQRDGLHGLGLLPLQPIPHDTLVVRPSLDPQVGKGHGRPARFRRRGGVPVGTYRLDAVEHTVRRLGPRGADTGEQQNEQQGKNQCARPARGTGARHGKVQPSHPCCVALCTAPPRVRTSSLRKMFLA
ncbi:hypothetical protein D3C85_910170 [compost metagenome]